MRAHNRQVDMFKFRDGSNRLSDRRSLAYPYVVLEIFTVTALQKFFQSLVSFVVGLGEREVEQFRRSHVGIGRKDGENPWLNHVRDMERRSPVMSRGEGMLNGALGRKRKIGCD